MQFAVVQYSYSDFLSYAGLSNRDGALNTGQQRQVIYDKLCRRLWSTVLFIIQSLISNYCGKLHALAACLNFIITMSQYRRCTRCVRFRADTLVFQDGCGSISENPYVKGKPDQPKILPLSVKILGCTKTRFFATQIWAEKPSLTARRILSCVERRHNSQFARSAMHSQKVTARFYLENNFREAIGPNRTLCAQIIYGFSRITQQTSRAPL